MRHERWALQFLIYIFKNVCQNDKSYFLNKYGITKILADFDDLIDITRRCERMFEDEESRPICSLIMDNYRVLERLDDNKKDRLYCDGLAKFYSSVSKKDEAKALDYYDTAVRLDPQFFPAYVHKDLKRSNDAIDVFDKALEIDEHDVVALVNKEALQQLKRDQEALQAFDKALNIKMVRPKVQSLIYYKKGHFLYRLNRYEEALQSFNNSILLNTAFQNAWIAEGQTLTDLQRYLNLSTLMIKL
jgi:tetratricopeptide (TPR) repeat protein